MGPAAVVHTVGQAAVPRPASNPKKARDMSDPAMDSSGSRDLPSPAEIIARCGQPGPGPSVDTLRQWLEERHANQNGSAAVLSELDPDAPVPVSETAALRELDRRLAVMQTQSVEIMKDCSEKPPTEIL